LLTVQKELKVAYLTFGFSKLRGGPTLLFNFAKAVATLSNISVEFHAIEDQKVQPVTQAPEGLNMQFHQLARAVPRRGPLRSLFESIAAIIADVPYAGVLDSVSFFHVVSRLGPLRYSSPPYGLVKLIRSLSLGVDILHMGAATMPYTFLSKISSGARAKLVVHALLHPPFKAFLDDFSLKKLDKVVDTLYWRASADFLKHLDAITVSTPYEMERFKALGCNKTFFVGEGVDLSYLEKKKESSKSFACVLRKRFGTPLLLYVGARNLQKGYLHTLLALQKLIEKGFRGKLVCIGVRSPVPMEFLTKISARALRAEEKLKKLGFLVDFGAASEEIKFAALQASHVIVLPSYVETVPLVFLEAWYFRKPAIGFKIPTLASVVSRQGDGALLAECGSIESLTEAIDFMISNPSFASETGEKGWKKLETFNLTQCARRLIKVYESICW
jgi:glycosyltransferase involved in cell wall biosynthesis